MNLQEFLDLLHVEHGPNAKGEYLCRCPAHDDRTASLCVSDGNKGIVLKCQAGCDTHAVLAAMGVKLHEIFHDTQAQGGQRKPAAKPAAAPRETEKKQQAKAQWERCKLIPSERADFLCKQLNIMVNTDDIQRIYHPRCVC